MYSDIKKRRQLLLIVFFCAVVFFPRVYGLGQVLTVDEPLWVDRGAAFVQRLATLQLADTIPALQPGVTTAWLAGITARFHSLAISQMAVGVATGILITICAYFLHKIWDPAWVWLGSFSLAVQPFLLGHSRVVHTDALLALLLLTATLSIIVFGERLLQRQVNIRYAVYAGLLLGFAIITKVFGLAMVPLHILVLAWYLYQVRASVPLIVRTYIIWIFSIGIAMLAAWPVLWVQVGGTIRALYSGISAFEEGTRSGEVTDMWWYYAREGIFRLTPMALLMFPLTLVGSFRFRHTILGRSTAVLFLCGFIFAVIMSIKGEKSDRYILFTILTMELVSVIGFRLVVEALQKYVSNTKYVLGTIFILTAGYSAYTDIRLHPYHLSYYNPLYPIEQDHKLGWGEGLEQAVDWVESKDPAKPVASFYPRVFSYFYNGTGEVTLLSHIPEANTGYVVLYRSMFERAPDSPESDLLAEYLKRETPLHTVYINNLPYAWVFPSKN